MTEDISHLLSLFGFGDIDHKFGNGGQGYSAVVPTHYFRRQNQPKCIFGKIFQHGYMDNKVYRRPNSYCEKSQDEREGLYSERRFGFLENRSDSEIQT
jgi:hypothetical protein